MNREQKKNAFIEAVAEYMTENIGHKSIQVQMQTAIGKEWARVNNSIGFNAYNGKEKAIELLKEIL